MRTIVLMLCAFVALQACGRKASVDTVPGTIIGDETSFFFVEGKEDEDEVEFEDYFADDDEADE